MRPYADTMRELIAGVGRAAASVRGLPLLEQRETVETVLIVPLTGDRGLAGAFNAQVHAAGVRARARARRPRARRSAGSRSARRDARRSRFGGARSTATLRRLHRRARPTRTRRRSRIARPSCSSSGEVDRVVLVYNTFVSALTQTVTEQDILPISADVLETDDEERARRRVARRLHLRARARGDPRAAAARLRRDGDLPRAARVGGVRAGRADDGDAQRLEERGRADRPPDAAR